MVEREGRAHNSPREQTREHDDMAASQHRQGVAQQRESYETTFTPSSGVPFQIIYTPGGKIRVSGELTSPERADEFIRAIEALKLLMARSNELQRLSPGKEHDEQDDPPTEEKPSQASVSLMITQEQKAALRQRGYTDEQIHEMKPEDAHRTLELMKGRC
jgi:hypothetical protein